VVVLRDKEVRLVSDAKYKGSWVKNNDKWEPKKEELDRADLYQLVSTCLACNCGHGLIVRPRLPSTNGKARTFELWTVPVNNLLSQEIRIGVVWLDLSRPTGREWRNQLISELGVAIEEVGLKP
jgi:5-methylcytosine-specific restriction endonuclease McrBC regulatory subunit McrC